MKKCILIIGMLLLAAVTRIELSERVSAQPTTHPEDNKPIHPGKKEVGKKLGVIKLEREKYDFNDKYEIRGRILFPDGSAARQVILYYAYTHINDSVITDENGFFAINQNRFRTPLFEPSDFSVFAVAPLVEDASWKWAVPIVKMTDILNQAPEQFVFRLQKGTKIEGHILRKDGKNLSEDKRQRDINIVFNDIPSIWHGLILPADKTGKYSLCLPPGHYTIRPDQTSWDGAGIEFMLRENDPPKKIDLQLPVPVRLKLVRKDGSRVRSSVQVDHISGFHSNGSPKEWKDQYIHCDSDAEIEFFPSPYGSLLSVSSPKLGEYGSLIVPSEPKRNPDFEKTVLCLTVETESKYQGVNGAFPINDIRFSADESELPSPSATEIIGRELPNVQNSSR